MCSKKINSFITFVLLLNITYANTNLFNYKPLLWCNFPFGYVEQSPKQGFIFMNTETWKPVIGYEGLYLVSNTGNVKSIAKNKVFALCYDNYGYPIVSLTKNKKAKTKTVHRLVALAFIPNPDKKPQVNHIDGNKSNNSVENLEWATNRENVVHSFKQLGRIGVRGGRHPISKQIYQYTSDGTLISEYESYGDVFRKTGYSISAIHDCCNGRWSSAYGFIWSHRLMSKQETGIVKIGHSTSKRPVIQHSLDGKVIAEYDFVKDAARKTGISASHISRSCKGAIMNPRKFIWKFKT